MFINLIIFVVLVVLIVVVTRNVMIYNIRKLSILLRWNNKVVGQILGYATSTPELISAIVAGSIGLIETSIFNVMSSNFINVILVIIVTMLNKRTASIVKKKFTYDYIIILITLMVPVFLSVTGLASTIYAIPLLLLIYLVYIYGSKYVDYFAAENEELELEKQSYRVGVKNLKRRKIKVSNKKKIFKSTIMLILSLIALYLLGSALSSVLEKLGKDLGVPEIILGIIMGFVTSVPELLTFITSYHRHRRYKDPNKDKGAVEVINNLATSNVSNLTIIQTVAIIAFIIFAT
ncbi:MAG: hypothetical protein RR922_04625 [Clostridia bacterium]